MQGDHLPTLCSLLFSLHILLELAVFISHICLLRNRLLIYDWQILVVCLQISIDIDIREVDQLGCIDLPTPIRCMQSHLLHEGLAWDLTSMLQIKVCSLIHLLVIWQVILRLLVHRHHL